MKKLILPSILLTTALSCGQPNADSSVLTTEVDNIFAKFNWKTDSGLELKRSSSDDRIYQDAELSFYHRGETKDGKNLHNLDVKVMSHAQFSELGSIEAEFSDLECVKTRVRVGLRRLAKVTCKTAQTTDQRDEALVGAPQVELIMQQLRTGKIDAKLSVDRGFEKQVVSIKKLAASQELFYGESDAPEASPDSQE